jgi:hypothetical protein
MPIFIPCFLLLRLFPFRQFSYCTTKASLDFGCTKGSKKLIISGAGDWMGRRIQNQETTIVFGGSVMFIPNPGSEFFPSRIRIKEFKYLTQKMVSLLSEI